MALRVSWEEEGDREDPLMSEQVREGLEAMIEGEAAEAEMDGGGPLMEALSPPEMFLFCR